MTLPPPPLRSRAWFMLLAAVAAGAGACATGAPSPASPPAEPPEVRLARQLEALKQAPLAPASADELRRAWQAVPGAAHDLAATRAVGDAPAPLRLVGLRQDHAAVAVIAARARALHEEAVEADRLPVEALEAARSALQAEREALVAQVTVAAAEARRVQLREAALKVEVLAWQLAVAVARELGGPVATPARLDALPEALLADPEGALAGFEPIGPDYRVVAQGLRHYRALAAAAGELPPLTPDRRWKRLRPGKRDPDRVPALRARLAAEGFEAAPEGRPEVYDETLGAALARFQRRHGLARTGRPGPATLRALSLPLSYRVLQLTKVLQHLRRDLARTEPYRLQVNIPAFRLRLIRDGAIAATHNVVVGNNRLVVDEARGERGRLNQTPTLASRIGQLVFNPAWHVPQRIKDNELDVIASRRPEIYDDYRLFTDSHGVERAVQLPGPRNALGRVKFVFPYGGGVYLHDTPRQRDFARSERGLSHGCVRVEGALELARTLLEHDRHRLSWERVQLILYAQHETPVGLRTAVPVFLDYVTAGSDADGQLTFYPDLYDRGPVVPATQSWPPRPQSRRRPPSPRAY